MNDTTVEAACWRIWYRLKTQGEEGGKGLMINCGIEREVFEKAIDTLLNFGNIQATETASETLKQKYKLNVEDPHMIPGFPPIEGENE